MIQFNISIFIEHAIDSKALSDIQHVILPQLINLTYIDQAHTFEILSHQEPDSKGYSIQCLIPAKIPESIRLFSKPTKKNLSPLNWDI